MPSGASLIRKSSTVVLTCASLRPRGAPTKKAVHRAHDPTARARRQAKELDRTQDLACAKLERDRAAVIESYAGMLPEALDVLSREERRRLYGMVRLEVAPTPDGLEVSGALGMSDPVRQLRDETGDAGRRRHGEGAVARPSG